MAHNLDLDGNIVPDAEPMEVLEKMRFDGSGSSCDAVTIFLGGCNASHTHEWKSRTNDGGWVIQADGTRDEFHPGDYICKLNDGSYAVAHVCKRGW